MKKLILTLLLFFTFTFPFLSFADQYVNGYYRSNGTYVNGYYRSSPDGNPYNNYSYPGNTNPYTGKTATGNADTYLDNYYSSPSTANYSPYSTPTCPLNSYSDGTSCKCNYGYSASGGKCVSNNQSCQDQLGYNSSYDSLSDKCKCSYGYVIGSSGQCVSGDSYCSDKMGIMSTYDSLSKTCGCMSGYEFDGSQCTYKKTTYSSYDDNTNYDTNTCPANSSISLTDSTKCSCNTGYVTNSTKDGCILEPVKIKEPVYTPNTKITSKEPSTLKTNKQINNVKIDKKISTSTATFDEILKGNQNISIPTTTPEVQTKKINWFTKFLNLFKF